MSILINETDDALDLSFLSESINKVKELEKQVLKLPQVDLKTENIVHGGMCSRTIFVPAGTVVTGALTNIENICILIGDITVTTSEGMKRFTGHHILSAESGFKRAGYAHTDTYWTTVWKTELKNISEIEDEMTSESHLLQTRAPLLNNESNQKLEISWP